MPGREDYILKFVALLREAIAQMVKYREKGRYADALDAALQVQEKLFVKSTAELSTLSLDELIRLLRVDETPASGDEKVLGYAALLRETGLVYAAMSRTTPAESCFQLSLHVMLTVAAAQPAPSAALLGDIRELLARVPPEQLHPPVAELLAQLGAILNCHEACRQNPHPAAQLAGFIAKYSPEIAAHGTAVLKKFRTLLPPAVEMVYDNYNFLVVGFVPGERPSEAVFSIIFAPDHVSLCFIQGAKLPDPHGLLQGSGNQVRHIRLPSVGTLDEPAVRLLITTALQASPASFDEVPARKLVIKAVSAKQRPRRKSPTGK